MVVADPSAIIKLSCLFLMWRRYIPSVVKVCFMLERRAHTHAALLQKKVQRFYNSRLVIRTV